MRGVGLRQRIGVKDKNGGGGMRKMRERRKGKKRNKKESKLGSHLFLELIFCFSCKESVYLSNQNQNGILVTSFVPFNA